MLSPSRCPEISYTQCDGTEVTAPPICPNVKPPKAKWNVPAIPSSGSLGTWNQLGMIMMEMMMEYAQIITSECCI